MPKVKKISVRQRKAAIDKAIVAAVRDRPALFDKRDPNYMNPTKTVALWLEVAEVAQYNGEFKFPIQQLLFPCESQTNLTII